MNDLEILAELKRSYELIIDITENATDTQLKSVKEFNEIIYILADKYNEIYEKINNENDILLYYEENLKISPYINCDYIDSSKNYINAGDLELEKWYEDITFFKEFGI